MLRHLMGACAAAVAVTALAAPAASAGVKSYSVDITPGVSAAAPDAVFEARITNDDTTRQSLGSVDLTAPRYLLADTGFRVRDVSLSGASSAATATTDGAVVRARDLSLAPGATALLRMVVDTTSAAGTWRWSVAAKQANDFNGTGNDFVLDAAASSLESEITQVPGERVTVPCPEEDAATADGTTCRLSITWQGLGPAQPGTSTPLFGAQTRAAAADADLVPYAVTFAIVSPPAAAGNAGNLEAALPNAEGIDCLGLAESSPVTGLVTGPANRSKRVTWTVDAAFDFAGPADAMCYGGTTPSAPNPRFPLGGAPVVSGGTVFFPAALPDCAVEPAGLSLATATPCTSKRALESGNQVTVTDVPATTPDPTYRG